MKCMKIISKLGFDSKIISDLELRKEFVFLCENLLSKFELSEDIISHPLFIEEQSPQKIRYLFRQCHFVRAYSKSHDSYDLQVIIDSAHNTYELVFNSSIQRSFSDPLFGISFSFHYDAKSEKLQLNMLYKDTDLVVQKYLYTRDSINNQLVLIGNEKVYFDTLVEKGEDSSIFSDIIKENIKLNHIYCKGNYNLEDTIPAASQFIAVTKKQAKTFNLLVDNKDTSLIACAGTILYDGNVSPVVLDCKPSGLDNNELLFKKQIDDISRYDAIQRSQDKVNRMSMR